MREKYISSDMVKKLIKKAKKPDYVPYTISIQKMCEKADMIPFFNVIRNRIYDELEQDATMGDYIRIEADNMEDIFLDDKGVFMFSDILMSYFGEDSIIHLWKYMDNLNKLKCIEYDMQQIIEACTTKKLKEMLEEYRACVKAPQPEYKEAAETVRERIQEELKKRRRPFKRILRA